MSRLAPIHARKPLPLLSSAAALALTASIAFQANAYVVNISSGSRAVFLQVGVGSMTGGTFQNGGTPANNTVVNTASVNVPATAIGSGTAQVMTTDSTTTASPWDGYAYCDSPSTTGEVYVGGFYRGQGSNPSSATLSVTTPAALTSASGKTIPFSQIAWTSTGNGDNSATVPSGSFTTGSQQLLTVSRNTWFESCLAFRYLNTLLVPSGTFTGRATFTLTSP